MGIMDILQQYASSAVDGTQRDSTAHFDEVAKASSAPDLGRGISDAMRSDQTPPFGDMVGQLFAQSNPQQRAGVLNQILGSIGPGVLASLPGALGGILGRATGSPGATPTEVPHLSPEQASQVDPGDVSALAAHAEKHDGGVVDQVGAFYGQHPELVKGLGAMALAVVLGKMAHR